MLHVMQKKCNLPQSILSSFHGYTDGGYVLEQVSGIHEIVPRGW